MPERQPAVLHFGKRVRELRKARGLSQEGFALLVGLDRTYIGGIERGERNPALKTILKIADTLGVLAGDLFKVTEQQDAVAQNPNVPAENPALKARLHQHGSSYAAVAKELGADRSEVVEVARGDHKSVMILNALARHSQLSISQLRKYIER